MSKSPRWTHARSGHSASTPSSCRRVLSANRTLTRRARPPTGRVKTADCCSAVPGSASATRRRGDAEAAWIASASEESIDPVVFAGPGCPLAATNVCPNACRIHEPTLPGCSAEGPPRLGRAQPSGSPRSHCFDVTQVRGRAAKRARHRRGHIFSPVGWRSAAKWRSFYGAGGGDRKLQSCPRGGVVLRVPRCSSPTPDVRSSVTESRVTRLRLPGRDRPG